MRGSISPFFQLKKAREKNIIIIIIVFTIVNPIIFIMSIIIVSTIMIFNIIPSRSSLLPAFDIDYSYVCQMFRRFSFGSEKTTFSRRLMKSGAVNCFSFLLCTSGKSAFPPITSSIPTPTQRASATATSGKYLT